MKCKNMFLGKVKLVSICCLLEILPRVLSVKSAWCDNNIELASVSHQYFAVESHF